MDTSAPVIEGLNEPLIRQIVAHIEEDPSTWKQSTWVHYNCKTSFCFAGWAVVLSGLVTEEGVPTEAGHAFTHKHGFHAPRVDNGEEEDSPDAQWYFPYQHAASILLGTQPYGAAVQLFNSAAAKWRNEYGDILRNPDGSIPPDSIDAFKLRITALTGVTFDETPEPAAA